MFKVFRRDALYGLNLVCNRFDFDIELVMKLVRKGYIPVELPVNYISRSHTEAFQAVVWHGLVSHPKLLVNEMKWESVR